MTDPSPGPEGEEIDRIEARSYFVRQRNALAIRCHFSPLYTDHYLHLMQHGIKLDPELDLLLKEALAAFTLHLVARPIRETIAWTLNFQDPLCNLFVTGGSLKQRVVGRVFTEDVKQGGENTFFSQIAVP
ncbi:MAG: disulfide bond chaperone, partial [Verrucomicrobiota bacterium]